MTIPTWLELWQWLDTTKLSWSQWLTTGFLTTNNQTEQIELTNRLDCADGSARDSLETCDSDRIDDLVLPTVSLDQFLVQAVQQGDTAAVVDYLEQGADPCYNDNVALRTAILTNKTDIVLNLLQYGASL